MQVPGKAICHIPGYDFIHRNRESGRGGGVAIYCKNSLHASEELLVGTTPPEIENIFGKIDGGIIVGEIYRQPNTKENFFVQFLETCTRSFKKSKLIIGCDQNIDLLKTNNANVNHLLEVLNEIGLSPTITKPTRVTNSTATLIDQMYVSDNLYHKCSSKILVDDMSDHYPCLLCIQNNNKKYCDPIKFKGRLITDENINKMLAYLSCYNWENLNRFCVDECANLLTNVIQTGLDIYCPEKETIVKPHKIIKEPWMSRGLLRSNKKCKKLYVKWKTKLKDVDESKYREYRNTLNCIKRHAKIKYYHKEFTENYGNMRKSWLILNKLIGRVKNKNSVPSYIMCNEEKVFKLHDICSGFNKEFATVGDKVNKKLGPTKGDFKKYLKNPTSCRLSFQPMTTNDVARIIQSLKNKTSFGNDGISNKMLRKLCTVICMPISIIINKSIKECKIPKEWKHAIVHPLYKTGFKHLVTNYRPISLLPTMSKILERVIHGLTYNYLNNNALLSNCQFGFRPGHSCIDCVNRLYYDLLRNRDINNYSMSVFCNLSKAFDVIDRNILFTKMIHYGITESSLMWFKNYFSERSQSVRLNNETSDKITIDLGVGQGSILGPLVLCVMLNDMYDICKYSNLLGYADDTTLYHSYDNIVTLYARVKCDLKLLLNWFNCNRLCLNTDKTKVMVFNKNTAVLNQCQELFINESSIERVTKFKLIGIVIDEKKLDWKSHFQSVLSKLQQGIFSLRSTYNLLPEFVKLRLYYFFIYSHLSYGIELWGNSIVQHLIAKLQVIQNNCIHYILRLKPRDTITAANFRTLKLLDVNSVIKYHMGKFMYQYSNGMVPNSLKNVLERDLLHDYETRQHKQNVVITESLYNAKLWEIIPQNFKILGYKCFSNHLKSHLISRL